MKSHGSAKNPVVLRFIEYSMKELSVNDHLKDYMERESHHAGGGWWTPYSNGHAATSATAKK